jgi:glutaredoxin
MTSRDRPTRLALLSRATLTAAALLLASASQAQFKVIGADGKVTYSDREPGPAEGKVTALGARAPVQAPEPELPFELRQVAARYPVTLYTLSGACEPCILGRTLLRQRGIPYVERQVVSPEDSEALERLSGAREAPTLAVGSQILRGLAVEVWQSYLDAAGYPRDSRLPSTYQHRPATPIVERREAAPARQAPATATAAARPLAPTPAPIPGAAGIRF